MHRGLLAVFLVAALRPLMAQERPPAYRVTWSDAASVSAAGILYVLPVALRLPHGAPSCAPCDPGTLPSVDRWALGSGSATGDVASDMILTGVAGFTAFAGLHGLPAHQWRGNFAVFANAASWTAASTEWLKVIVHRKRAVLYTAAAVTAANDRESQLSFPSLHASLAFAAATSYLVIARRQHLPHWTRNTILLCGGAECGGATGPVRQPFPDRRTGRRCSRQRDRLARSDDSFDTALAKERRFGIENEPMLRFVLAAMLLSASPQSDASAQARPPQPPLSVYHISPKVDLPVTIGASLGIVLPYAFADRLIKPRCPCNPQEVNSFDRGAIGNTNPFAGSLSDATARAVIILPLVADAFDVGVSPPLMEDGAVFIQTLAVNGALVTAAKYSVQRPLPRTYAGDPNLIAKPAGYRSFYSGHTSLVFAALSATAMTIRLRHGEKTWPWIVTAVVGASVAIERVADGRHFPTDVIAGAVMGTATGIAVPSLHERRRSSARSWTVGPTGNGGIAIVWSGEL